MTHYHLNNNTKKSILITGGAGYIGSHTAVLLGQSGQDIVIIDNLSQSHKDTILRIETLLNRKIPFYHLDLKNTQGLRSVFQQHPIDGVIHFAGYKAVKESVDKPLMYYENNLESTLSLLKVMEEYRVKNLVFSSSATVYGSTAECPIPESAPICPINPYGQTKAMIESILFDLGKSDSHWRISLLRYFNPVGAHPSGLLGEHPRGIPNNLMPFVSQVAIGLREKLSIFGQDYPTKDGTCIRDYIHVMDLALGHKAALHYMTRNTEPVRAFNLGTGHGYSVLEVVKTFEEASGQVVPFTIAPRREGDGAINYALVERAEKELGWKAKKNLFDMCFDAWNWQKNLRSNVS